MKIRFALIAITVVLGCTGAYGQSAAEIEIKYGKSVDVYSVGELLWMTPSYDNQGQVCMMRVYPKIVSPKTTYLSSKLDIEATLRFINELFPVHTRGRRGELFGFSFLSGGIAETSFKYEHVHFVFQSSFRLDRLTPEKMGEFVLLDDLPADEASVAEYKRQEAMTPDDQLFRKQTSSSQVLEIKWVNRKCVKQ